MSEHLSRQDAVMKEMDTKLDLVFNKELTELKIKIALVEQKIGLWSAVIALVSATAMSVLVRLVENFWRR